MIIKLELVKLINGDFPIGYGPRPAGCFLIFLLFHNFARHFRVRFFAQAHSLAADDVKEEVKGKVAGAIQIGRISRIGRMAGRG